ncbi:MAG: FAD-dependent monooxygenase [Jatrophihabitans sp.]|uniref:FAD-dependent monooxygenase n=1 Tax=Jatrophihabitans sp. TaxID=1932789 RepID=UPI00390D830C
MTTSSRSNQCQVLVVGAGPTGLTLAAQLLARGIPTRIVDKRRTPAPYSRALGVSARTLELLDTMGMSDAFVDVGHRVHEIRMYSGHRTLVRESFRHNGSRFGFVLHLPQEQTETLLRARVAELGGTVEHGVELAGFDANDAGVDVTLRTAHGQTSQTSVGYVVGCDGAHSVVRERLGFGFVGQPYPQDWLLADVTLDGAGSDDAVHLFFRANGLPLTCIPIGGSRWRVTMPNAGDRAGRPPTFDEIQELVAQRAPRPMTLADPRWLSCFRAQLRITTSYRRGRVLLAGDAAHVHSPAGGQGMNTGMLDAANLSWKLALVADRRAPDALLDTYEQERLPVARAVLGLTDKLVGLLTMRQPVKRAVRDTVLPIVTSLPAVQRRAAGRLAQTLVAYGPGALVRPDDIRRGLRPGQRCPDFEVRGRAGVGRLHRLLGSGRHVLIVSSKAPSAATALDRFGNWAELVEVVEAVGHDPGAALTLVRPDGVVAVRASGRAPDHVLAYLHQLVAAPASSVDTAQTGRIVTSTAL